MPYTKKGEHLKAAAEAHSDLNMFAAIQALCESSLFSSASYPGEGQIVRICKRQQAMCLARYDRHMEKAGGGTYGR